MLHSLALWLRLALMRAKRPGFALRALADVPRPQGRVIWVQIGAEGAADTALAAAHLLERLHQAEPGLHSLLARPAGLNQSWPDQVQPLDLPPDHPAIARMILSQMRPSLVLLLGNDLPPALISAAAAQQVPVMLADARLSPLAQRRGFFARMVQRALLHRLCALSIRDQESLAPLLRLGASPAKTEVGGLMGEPPQPLLCSEAERSSMAALTRTRPVWLAAAVPASEIGAVIAAQEFAQRHAHRMLLLLAPDTPETGPELATRLAAEGWSVARRSLEGEPDTDTDIFIADDEGEYGLWYRIAPVSYMGGTLSGSAGHARSPLEAAALGSAIVHGPQTAPFAAEYTRLAEARAARRLADEASLGETIADLMSPDRAAFLAHNAWAVTSGGTAAAETVARAVLRQLAPQKLVESA